VPHQNSVTSIKTNQSTNLPSTAPMNLPRVPVVAKGKSFDFCYLFYLTDVLILNL